LRKEYKLIEDEINKTIKKWFDEWKLTRSKIDKKN
jgi:hypothetical protein